MEVASEKQASNIVMLNISRICTFADFFVILTVESKPQMKAVIDEMDTALKKAGVRLHHKEGSDDSGWTLLDFGDVIVHIFRPEVRELYQLELLWNQAQEVVRIQ